MTYKHGIYVLSHELPSPPAKTEALLMLAMNSWKSEIKLFPFCAISHEN